MKNKKINIIFMIMIFMANMTIDGRYISVMAYEKHESSMVRISEDIDNNGHIDIYDLSIVATAYNSIKGSTYYHEEYDLNSDGIIDLYDLTMVSKKIGVSVRLEAGSYEENNALIKYVGTWNNNSSTSHSGGNIKYSSTKGDYAEIKFYGTGIELYSLFDKDYGKVKIYIDGELTTTKDLYLGKPYYNKLSYYNNGLTLGEHTLKIEVSGEANASSTGKKVSIDRIIVNNKAITNANYTVYQYTKSGDIYVGQYPTKEDAIKEAGLYSTTYVKDSTGKEIWTNSYRVYQRIIDGTVNTVKGRFKTKDEAIDVAKGYEWGYVTDPAGNDVWNRGYPAKIKTAILESYGPSTSHAKGTETLAVGTQVTIINKEGSYYLVEYKITNTTKKRVYVPTANVTVSSKYTINTAANTNTVMYSKSAQNVNGGPGLVSLYPKIGSISLNEKVTELCKENGYSLIEYDTSSGRKRGYVLSNTLTSTKPATVGYVYNVDNTLNVRKGPSTSDTIIGKLYYGNKVEIVDSSNANWHKIKFNDGYGYVHKDYITFTKPTSNFPHSLDYYVQLQSKKLNLTDESGTWKNATNSQIKYYMNPSNFTQNNGKYMFMKLTYIDGITTTVANEAVSGKGILNGKGAAFLEGGKKYNVNPIYLIAHARLETGNGKSALSNGVKVTSVDGKAVTPRVTYNMYGIGAIDSDPLRGGAEFAYKQGWFTPELAIIGGAKFVGEEYIHSRYEQDTLYKMRWNVTNIGVGNHQYATDIGWAYKQSTMMAPYLNKCTNVKFEFDIPTFTATLWEYIREKTY